MTRPNVLNTSNSKFTPTKNKSTPKKLSKKSSFSTYSSQKPKIQQSSKFQIKTYVRIRPDEETSNLTFTEIGSNYTKLANSEKTFKFNQIFTSTDNQQEIFDNVCEELLDSSLRGFNVCIFAYGYTGTGKTYTMFGKNEGDGKDMGMIQRFCQELFISNVKNIKVSFYEIYAECVRDLLSGDGKSLKINYDPIDHSFYVDSVEFDCKNLERLEKIIDLGLSKRATGATVSNSHAKGEKRMMKEI